MCLVLDSSRALGTISFALQKLYIQKGNGIRRLDQKKIPTPKTEAGKNQTNNQVLIP